MSESKIIQEQRIRSIIDQKLTHLDLEQMRGVLGLGKRKEELLVDLENPNWIELWAPRVNFDFKVLQRFVQDGVWSSDRELLLEIVRLQLSTLNCSQWCAVRGLFNERGYKTGFSVPATFPIKLEVLSDLSCSKIYGFQSIERVLRQSTPFLTHQQDLKQAEESIQSLDYFVRSRDQATLKYAETCPSDPVQYSKATQVMIAPPCTVTTFTLMKPLSQGVNQSCLSEVLITPLLRYFPPELCHLIAQYDDEAKNRWNCNVFFPPKSFSLTGPPMSANNMREYVGSILKTYADNVVSTILAHHTFWQCSLDEVKAVPSPKVELALIGEVFTQKHQHYQNVALLSASLSGFNNLDKSQYVPSRLQIFVELSCQEASSFEDLNPLIVEQLLKLQYQSVSCALCNEQNSSTYRQNIPKFRRISSDFMHWRSCLVFEEDQYDAPELN